MDKLSQKADLVHKIVYLRSSWYLVSQEMAHPRPLYHPRVQSSVSSLVPPPPQEKARRGRQGRRGRREQGRRRWPLALALIPILVFAFMFVPVPVLVFALLAPYLQGARSLGSRAAQSHRCHPAHQPSRRHLPPRGVQNRVGRAEARGDRGRRPGGRRCGAAGPRVLTKRRRPGPGPCSREGSP